MGFALPVSIGSMMAGVRTRKMQQAKKMTGRNSGTLIGRCRLGCFHLDTDSMMNENTINWCLSCLWWIGLPQVEQTGHAQSDHQPQRETHVVDEAVNVRYGQQDQRQRALRVVIPMSFSEKNPNKLQSNQGNNNAYSPRVMGCSPCSRAVVPSLGWVVTQNATLQRTNYPQRPVFLKSGLL